MLRRLVVVPFAAVVVAAAGASGADGPGGSTGEAWSRLPDPPFVRSGAARAWTGRGLLLWGGEQPDGSFPADGAFYDARRRRWRPLPQAPISGRARPAVAWTGSELVVWGGWAGQRVLDTGAALRPAIGEWRRLPPAPLTPRIPAVSVWTGRELVVWGDAARSGFARDGAAYDPARNRWRRLPPAPLALNQATAVWVAGRMVVYGARLDGGNHSKTRWARGIAYVPAANRWRVIAPFSLSPQASSVAAAGGKVVVWDYLLDAGLYDPRTDRWTRLPRLPLKESECYPASTTIRGSVLGWYCGRGALLRPSTHRWRRVQPPRLRVFGEAPVAAGSRALFLGDPGGTRKAELWAYTP